VSTSVVERPKGARRWPRRTLVGLAVFAVALIGFRLALPGLIKKHVNRTLDRLPGYGGRVDDIDVHLWRGAYKAQGIALVKEEGETTVPFVSVEALDLSVQWRELFRGSLVAEIDALHPEINFVGGKPAEAQGVKGQKAEDWRETVKKLFPLRINRFVVRDGAVRFRNFNSRPPVDVRLDGVQVEANNLTNSEEKSDELMARFTARGRPMGRGSFDLRLKMNPLADVPTFDMDTTLKDLSLPALNTFFRHYAGIDVQGGTLSLYSEATARDGKFRGYVKPIIKDLNVLNSKKEKNGFWGWLKELTAEAAGEALENQPKDQVATRIAFSGNFEDPRVAVWRAAALVLRNAFLKAIPAGLEDEIGFDSRDGK